MKKSIVLTAIVLTVWGIYHLRSSSPEDKIRNRFEEVLEMAEVEKQLNPVQAAMRIKDMMDYLNKEISVTYTVNGKERTVDDMNQIKTGAISALGYLKNFDFELLKNEVHVENKRAVMQAKIRGRGEILNYMERFSEVHRFRITFLNQSGEWKISRVKHIPYQTP